MMMIMFICCFALIFKTTNLSQSISITSQRCWPFIGKMPIPLLRYNETVGRTEMRKGRANNRNTEQEEVKIEKKRRRINSTRSAPNTNKCRCIWRKKVDIFRLLYETKQSHWMWLQYLGLRNTQRNHILVKREIAL